jgi:hypothetical protein
MKKFLKDLDSGKKGENLLLQLLNSAGYQASANESRKKLNLDGWDIQVQQERCPLYFEVKYDLYSARSGNVAVEFFNPKIGKLSGITATKAHLWVFVFPDSSIWMSCVNKLKNFCSTTPPLKVIAAGGDDNSSMYIYKKDIILPAIFTKVDQNNIKNFLGNFYENLRNNSLDSAGK